MYPSYSPPELCPLFFVSSGACLSPATMMTEFVPYSFTTVMDPVLLVAMAAGMSYTGLPLFFGYVTLGAVV